MAARSAGRSPELQLNRKQKSLPAGRIRGRRRTNDTEKLRDGKKMAAEVVLILRGTHGKSMHLVVAWWTLSWDETLAETFV